MDTQTEVKTRAVKTQVDCIEENNDIKSVETLSSKYLLNENSGDEEGGLTQML